VGHVTDESFERLLVVQDLDTLLTQLAHRREVLNERSGLTGLAAELEALATEKAALLAQRGVLADTQKDLEAHIATLNERSSAIETRMYAARGSSTRDLQAMDEEVRHLNQRRRELEDEELVAMVDQEPIDAALAALEARTAPLEAKVNVLRGEVALERSEIEAELATATASRAAEVALLPEPLAARYETLRARLRGTGAARLIGNRCDGCHLELSSAEVERIRATTPESVVTCDQCGRILVPT
jgi:predicted  nucleic acid-binding Zn-ribbon protein